MYECFTCIRNFYSEHALQQHMDDKNHWPPRYGCESCPKIFNSQHAAIQHMNAVRHWKPKIPCEKCSAMFHREQDADQHMSQLGHYKHYCTSCRQRFQNENNLRMHLNSKIHRPATVSCPCCGILSSATGVAHHLERGACPHARRLNRETIFRAISERDPHGIIANKQIEWHREKTVEYLATDSAFNGDGWECYICHRVFVSMRALNQHVNSPVHKQNIYHCPNAKSKCGKEFQTVAALFNHLESESCAFMRFEMVRHRVTGVLGGNRLISF
ncbi:hypothetical protein PAAG_01356 [Paracoccidioides lutzii Pb01]|uniref:C2H2-type domain-containing protein n=1 Tax=Paracoccidioides lutzii (strain ATCC MYA-826 / Pb01) TaxID=502779 RepID=C1GS61_PARBA|nr:hypothetical protein PAAG_01356 [Paracoccidioides lutzii Pb01]EEH38894.2 hypothetical protein PAAG_01356 [Paracoccidioides lutzii Pb01]